MTSKYYRSGCYTWHVCREANIQIFGQSLTFLPCMPTTLKWCTCLSEIVLKQQVRVFKSMPDVPPCSVYIQLMHSYRQYVRIVPAAETNTVSKSLLCGQTKRNQHHTIGQCGNGHHSRPFLREAFDSTRTIGHVVLLWCTGMDSTWIGTQTNLHQMVSQVGQPATAEPKAHFLLVASVLQQGDHYLLTGAAELEAKLPSVMET